MLNDLEAKVAELEERMNGFASLSDSWVQESNKRFENQEVGLDLLKEMHDNNRIRIDKLENPPKRPRGRPRKIVNG